MGDDSEQIALDGEPPELTEQRFAENLRAIREASGMSQGRLADEMAARGWPWRQQTVTRVENGRRMVRLGEAKAVAEILSTSLDRLTWRTGEAKVVEELAAWTRQAKDAFRLIAESTAEQLRARGLLHGHPVVIGDDPSGSARIRNAVMEARDVQELTPEGAVAQGIARRVRMAEFYEWQGRDLPALRPQSIADAGMIADALRTGEVVIIDLTQTPPSHVQRIQDFVNGATRVRGGTVSRVGEMKYRVAPAAVNEREKAMVADLIPESKKVMLADLIPESKEDGT